MTAAAEAKLEVEIWRGTETGQFQTFVLPRRAHQTVLDVVTEIQREQDATLSYRFACRVGMCGSCAMVVNGRPRWTCRTRVSEVVGAGGRLAARAAAQFRGGQGPRGRDDAVLRQMERRQRAISSPAPSRRPISPWCRRQRRSARPPTPASNASAAASAIRPATWWPGTRTYLGPAALNRAWTLVNDVRDQGQTARLDAVSASNGCQACHTHMSCTTFCPKAIAPTYSIAGLKRAVLRRGLRGGP